MEKLISHLAPSLAHLLIMHEAAAKASTNFITDAKVVLADAEQVQTLPENEMRVRALPFTQTA